MSRGAAIRFTSLIAMLYPTEWLRCHARARTHHSLLDEKLLRLIPLVNEGNAIGEELSKGCRFAVKLLANQHQARLAVESDDTEDLASAASFGHPVRLTGAMSSRCH